MIRRPTLLLDCDEVLCAFVEGYLRVVDGVTGRRYMPEHVTRWDIGTSLGLAAAEREEVHTRIAARGFCATLRVLPDSQDGVRQLRDLSDLYIVTSPWSGPHWMAERRDWIVDHFGLPSDRIIQTASKHIIAGDFLVDDRAETLRRWKERHAGVALLWSTPHNRLDVDLERISGWSGLIERVRAWGRIEVGTHEPCPDQVDGDEAVVAAVARARGGAA